MLATVAEAASSRWTPNEELLATIAELVHSLLLVTLKANSQKGTRLPPALRIRRPTDKQAEPVKPAQLFRRLLGR